MFGSKTVDEKDKDCQLLIHAGIVLPDLFLCCSVLVSCYCHNKSPQMQWLKQYASILSFWTLTI
jgi:hypothetical protein